MAGFLLLKAKPGHEHRMPRVITRLNSAIDTHFAPYFKKIIRHNLSGDTFLVQFIKNDRQNIRKDDSGNWLALSGVAIGLHEERIYDAPELWRGYQEHGEDFLTRLDGHFVLALHDAARKQTLVVNDFMKNKTQFVTETDAFYMFTPFALLTAAIRPPKADPYAFNEFMWRYYILSYRSMLQDVERLRPASMYTITADGMRRKRYWQPPDAYTSASFEESASSLAESMRRSARLISALDAKPLVEFTMGQDSRMVLSAFTGQGLPFENAIFGKDDFPEVVHVKEMARRHDFTLHHVTLGQDFMDNPWAATAPSVILGSAEEPAYLMGRIRYMRRQYLPFARLAVNGVHGRFYKDGIWNEMYVMNAYREPRSFRKDIFIKYRALNKNYRDEVFIPEYKKIKAHSAQYLSEMINAAIRGYEKSPVAIQADVFDLFHYANFGYVANNICNMEMDVISPLLFRRNLDLALAMPARWKYVLSRLQRAVVWQLDPSLAAEKTDFGGLDMKPRKGLSYAWFWGRYHYAQSQKFRDKIKNLLGFSVKTQLQKAWDYTPVYTAMFHAARDEGLFDYQRMMLAPWIEKAPWQNLVQRYDHPQQINLEQYEYMLKWATVERFLRAAATV